MPTVVKLETLLDWDFDFNAKTLQKEAALLRAAMKGLEKELQQILLGGVDLKARDDKNGWTALHFAAIFGHPNTAQQLLLHGLGPEEKDAEEYTPLHLAVERGHKDVVQLLIENGADPEEKDGRGYTALAAAVVYRQAEVARFLIEKGVNLTATAHRGRNVLLCAAEFGTTKIARLLIEKGVDMTSTDDSGSTAVHVAAQRGHEEFLRMIIERGANVSAKDYNGWTALHRAARMGHEGVVKLLLEKGANAEEEVGGRTALSIAMNYGRESVVQLLNKTAEQKLPTSRALAMSLEDPAHPETIRNDYSRYTALNPGKDEIRLLRIRAFPKTSGIVCCVFRTSLQDHPPYTALSYCWGSLNTTVPITVYFDDGENINSKWTGEGSSSTLNSTCRSASFNITTNLYNALCSFRHHGTDIFIWNDMLCINQGDLSERSQQVALMTRIYSGAANVTVWLGGNPDAESDVLFRDEEEDLDIFLRLLEGYGWPKKRDLLEEWATVVSEFEAKDNYNDLDYNFQTPNEVVARNLYFLYSASPEETTELVHPRELESYFYNTVLDEKSVVFRLATFLSLYYEDECDPSTSRNESSEEHGAAWQSLFPILDRWHRIFFSPWCGRVWVIQEVASNATVRVRHSRQQTDWHLLSNYHLVYKTLNSMVNHVALHGGFNSLSVLPEFHLYFGSGEIQWHQLWSNIDCVKRKELSIFDLLDAVKDFSSTNPRDRIYAIAHLANDITGGEFVPDYSLTPAEVYANFTRWLIQTQKSLYILSYCEYHEHTQLGRPNTRGKFKSLPSWSPDYRFITRVQLGKPSQDEEKYLADGGRPARFLRVDNPRSLYIEGIIVARIYEVHHWDTARKWPNIWRNTKSEWGLYPANSGKSWTTDELKTLRKNDLLLERYIRLLVADFGPNPGLTEAMAEVILGTRAAAILGLTWREEHFLKRQNQNKHPKSSLVSLRNFLTRATLRRRVFISHDNRLGLGPDYMDEDDIIVILSGATVPFVLREERIEENATPEERVAWLRRGPVYKLIGECYLDGRMNGEIFDNPLFEDPLNIDPLDHDNVLDPENSWAAEYFKKGVYRRNFFHIQ